MIDFTTASRDEIGAVYDMIAAESGDDRFFTTKELDVLPKILAPNEQVLSFSSGLMNDRTWLIVLTDARVLFVDKRMLFGLTQVSIELDHIVSIQGETGLILGKITIADANDKHLIANVRKRTVNRFVNKIREAQAARASGTKMLSPELNCLQKLSADAAPSSTSLQKTGLNEVEQARNDRLFAAGAIDAAEWQRRRL